MTEPPKTWSGKLAQHTIQMRHAERLWHQMVGLDQREDECLRMFGIEVEYFMDERILRLPAQH